MNRIQSPVGVGVVSVLTILLVLTLAVFSALTYSTARADLALSQVNAGAVSAYYAADAQAVDLLREFQAGTAPELREKIPMTDTQELYLHFVRQEGSEVRVEAWRTQPADIAQPQERTLPVLGAEDGGN